jgi:type I restriction enzyme, S subunit
MRTSLVPLKKIVKIHYGKALKAGDRDETGQFPVFGSSGQVGTHNENLIDYPTLIIGRKGSVGKVTYAKLGGWAIDTAFYTEFIQENEVDLRYFFYALKNTDLARWTITTSIPGLNRDDLYSTEIPLPPLEEQKRIAAIVDKADRIRRKRQEAIRLTEELGRSIFLDMFGDPVTNPKGWEIKKLRSVIQSIDAGWSANAEERKCKEDDWGVLKVSAVTSGKFKPFENKSVGENPNFPKPPIIPKKGDLLFSRANTRELVAATCLVEQDYERIFLSDKLWRISVLKGLITPEYLKFLLTYQRYRDLLTKKATGTSGSMLNISQGKLLDMDAPIPDIDTQRKFSDLIWKSIEVSTRIRENNKESENLFNSLLQRAFRGEL